MSTKNGATREQYEQYNKDKRKAGDPVARRVVLDVFRFEDKQPPLEPFCAVLVWLQGERSPIEGSLYKSGDVVAWDVPFRRTKAHYFFKTKGTSWAYIPDIKEAT